MRHFTLQPAHTEWATQTECRRFRPTCWPMRPSPRTTEAPMRGMDFVERKESRLVIRMMVKDDGIGLTKQEKATPFHCFMQPRAPKGRRRAHVPDHVPPAPQDAMRGGY